MRTNVKCKTCGKIGELEDSKGLRRHLRLCHNIMISKKCDIFEHFELADQEAVSEISSCTRKVYIKNKNRKWTKWTKKAKGPNGQNIRTKVIKPFARIIYTPMGNKR